MLKRFSILSLALAPVITLAQVQSNTFNGQYVNGIITAISGWVQMLVPLLIGLAVVVLFYGLVKYIWGGADDKDGGKRIMIWGVITIAVMVSIWGLIGLLQNFTGIQSGAVTPTVTVPVVPAI